MIEKEIPKFFGIDKSVKSDFMVEKGEIQKSFVNPNKKAFYWEWEADPGQTDEFNSVSFSNAFRLTNILVKIRRVNETTKLPEANAETTAYLEWFFDVNPATDTNKPNPQTGTTATQRLVLFNGLLNKGFPMYSDTFTMRLLSSTPPAGQIYKVFMTAELEFLTSF